MNRREVTYLTNASLVVGGWSVAVPDARPIVVSLRNDRGLVRVGRSHRFVRMASRDKPAAVFLRS